MLPVASLSSSCGAHLLTNPASLPAFDFLAKKTGHSVDRNTSEKITDGARAAYEKATGKKVDPKYSN